MNSKKKQLARLGKYSNYVTGFILVFVILFSFYAIGLINRFTVINQSWHQYTSKMVMVSDELAKLQSALGYGGFIHNFKNYLIRKDPANWQLLKQDIRQINQALDNLNSYFEYEEELVAVKSIRMTVAAYEAKLLLLKNTSNLAVKDLDELVKQSDEEALQALSILKNRTHELNIKQQQDTSLAFKQAMNWMYFGSFLFALVLLFSFLLLKVLSYLKSATQDLITTVEDGELLMQHAPDPMIRVAENGTIANCNLQLESLFGYKKTN
ncbi:hypothetical protein RS130_23065 [Paraglaciecola aquimarina]|uniref:PAS domain-containing protein n=1 Tax=Paraglaciecola aquimarina TaxID=1235557 RepID=A0ABU3T296_9ALTE|nr:hypothetical protein [Paraglaciecola aquimarina]MDU0356388.1 hypothetical protein [Paraglaciecola aquimarina]